MEVLATHRCGHSAGNKGYVDLDIYNGSFYDLEQLLIPSENSNDDSEEIDTVTIDDDSVEFDGD